MATVPTPVASVPTMGTNTSSAGTPGVNNQNITPTIPAGVLQNTSAVQNNPYATATGSIPSISSGISTYNGDYTVAGDFTQVYGQGTGTAIINTLAGMGTSTDAAIQATAAESYSQAAKTDAGITSKLAAAGLSADSSTSALEHGDFWSNWNQSLDSTIASTEQSQENTLLQTLLGEGQAHGGDVSTWDNVLEGINDAVGIAGTFFGGGFAASGVPKSGGSSGSSSGGSLESMFGGDGASSFEI